MKKNIFSVMLTVLGMAVAVSFSSCGGGNNDDLDNVANVEQETDTMGYQYVTPCLQWNATSDEVKTYMDGLGGWSKNTATSTYETYVCNSPQTKMTYSYGGTGATATGLSSAMVIYYSNKEKEFADLLSKIESTYKCTLQKSSEDGYYYAENILINGRMAKIQVAFLTNNGASEMVVGYFLQTDYVSTLTGERYVEPCLKWYCSNQDVATYMSEMSGWKFSEGTSTVTSQGYNLDFPQTLMNYSFITDGEKEEMFSVIVTYNYCADGELEYIKNKIQTAYGCTLIEDTDNKSSVLTVYLARNVQINNESITIIVTAYNQLNQIVVSYGV